MGQSHGWDTFFLFPAEHEQNSRPTGGQPTMKRALDLDLSHPHLLGSLDLHPALSQL